MKEEIKEILDRATKLKDKCSCCEQIGNGVYISKYHEIETQNLAEAIYIINRLLDYITNLQEKLKVSQTNEETYRLEMQDITKILGLDEHTIFDEVKEYATNLQEEYEKEHYLVDKLTRQLNDEYKNTEYQCKQKEDYKSRIDKANALLDEMLERAYIDGEYIMYDYSTSELLEVKQVLQGEDKDA